jgi:hypothetical protein
VSAVVEQPPTWPEGVLPPAPRGSLFKAELHRFRARRFIQVLFGIGVLGWLAALVIGLLNYGVPGADDLAEARDRIAQEVEFANQSREQCLQDPGLPDDLPPEDFCGPPVTAEQFPLEFYVDKVPFDFGQTGLVAALGIAGLSAALAFVIGATWIGAEWSSRSIVALLFWAPRRVQVIGTKLGVLVLASAFLGVLAQVGWLAMAGIWDAFAGIDEPLPDGFWTDMLQTQARGVLLCVIAALLGFGLTNVVRNTGAALGIGFVYSVMVETIVRGTRPHWAPWLLTENAQALVQHGGKTIQIWDRTAMPDVNGYIEPTEYYLGNLQAATLLGAFTVVVIGIGVALFTRRDIH